MMMPEIYFSNAITPGGGINIVFYFYFYSIILFPFSFNIKVTKIDNENVMSSLVSTWFVKIGE